AATIRRLEHFEPRPSRVEDSGRGFYALWKLDTPTKDWYRAKRANKWLAQQLGGDTTWDAARILRLPGTWNPKPGVQRYATTVRTTNLVYALDDFGEAELTTLDKLVQESDIQPSPLPYDFQARLEVTEPRL